MISENILVKISNILLKRNIRINELGIGYVNKLKEAVMKALVRKNINTEIKNNIIKFQEAENILKRRILIIRDNNNYLPIYEIDKKMENIENKLMMTIRKNNFNISMKINPNQKKPENINNNKTNINKEIKLPAENHLDKPKTTENILLKNNSKFIIRERIDNIKMRK